MTRSTRVPLSRLSLALVAAMAMAPAFAQSTSSGIAGTVTGADGKPVAGADVTITHVESGTVSHATTDANGRYAAQGLRVGGPYTITVNGAAGNDTESNIYLELNKVATVDAHLGQRARHAGTVTVTAARISPVFSPDNKGLGTRSAACCKPRRRATVPSTTSHGSTRASVSPTRTTARSRWPGNRTVTTTSASTACPRTTLRPECEWPAVHRPADLAGHHRRVQHFHHRFRCWFRHEVGANINAAVTKSGTNESHGSLSYYAFKDASSMVGRLGGDAYDGFDKDEITGFTGGLIVKDRLLFFAAYEDEKLKGLKGVGTDAVSTGRISLDDVNQ
ncbi:MAG: carboxypeptidase-like regulatory domain-containing protein [Lysobacterales bacterium]